MLIDLDAPARERREPAAKRRPLLLAALLLAVAEAVGGAAPAAYARGVVLVADTGGMAATASVLVEDALIAAHLGANRETLIRAWPLVPSGPRWSTTVAGPSPRLFRHGTAIVADPGRDGELTVLDARTGRVRWHAPAGAATAVAGDRIAYWSGGDGRLRLADLATGRSVWSRPAMVKALAADSAGHLVAVGDGGLGTAYDMTDGRVLAVDRSLGSEAQVWDDGFRAAAVIGGRLYLYGMSAVTAFDATELTQLWRAEIGLTLAVRDCGAVICAVASSGPAALDPRTGRVRWADRRWRDITPAGIATGNSGRTALIDPATGRVLRELGRGGVVGDLMLRLGADRTWVTALADGRVYGLLPLVSPAGCAAAGPYLACSTAGQVVKVWRVKR